MARLLRCFLLPFFFILSVLLVRGQQCGNCKTTPSVALYDFAIKVQEPSDNSEKEIWKQLFWLARHANTRLFQQNQQCIRFNQPVYHEESNKVYLKEGIELEPLTDQPEILKVGATVANVPGAGSLSEFGDYITTGSVTRSGNNYILVIELQNACSRKTVAQGSIFFSPSSDSKYIEGIALQAATKISPLADKIREFELRERQDRNDFAIGGNAGGTIKINLVKKTLLPGESTDFTVQLNDCDGKPLGGRKISFASSKDEFKSPGTIGGLVEPAQVITDAAGKAKARFKMSAAKGQPAIINAHTLTGTGKSCMNVFFGSCKVDQLSAYKIEIDYTAGGSDASSTSSSEDGVILKAGSGRNWNVEYLVTAFYYPPPSQKPDEQIVIVADELSQVEKIETEPLVNGDDKVEIEPLVKNENEVEIEPLTDKNVPELTPLIRYAKGSRMGKSRIYFSGYSKLHGWGKDLSLLASPLGMTSDSAVQYENIFSSKPIAPSISMMFENNNLVFFSCSFEFPPDEKDQQPVSGSFGIEKNNKKYFPLRPTRVTDPNSVYKWVYSFLYRTANKSQLGNEIHKSKTEEGEIATIRIYTTF